MVKSKEAADLQKVDYRQMPLKFVVQKYIDWYPPPYHGLILDIKGPDELGLWTIYTYKDNTESFSDPKRESLWIWLKGMIEYLNWAAAYGAVQTEELERKPR
jgi:hypothetical protein